MSQNCRIFSWKPTDDISCVPVSIDSTLVEVARSLFSSHFKWNLYQIEVDCFLRGKPFNRVQNHVNLKLETTRSIQGIALLKDCKGGPSGNTQAQLSCSGLHKKWDLYFQAALVCQQLGFNGVVDIKVKSTYGPVPSVFAFDNVNCTGTETSLNDCPHANVDDCTSFEGAGVVCNTETAEG